MPVIIVYIKDILYELFRYYRLNYSSEIWKLFKNQHVESLVQYKF